MYGHPRTYLFGNGVSGPLGAPMSRGTTLALAAFPTEGGMQVIAIGKWSKVLKRFQTVVSIRRPQGKDSPTRRPPTRPGPRANGTA